MSSGRPRDQDVWFFDDRVRGGNLQVSYEKARGKLANFAFFNEALGEP